MVGSLKVYVGSKSKHYAWWAALRAAGVPIAASWLDWPGNRGELGLTDQDWREHSETCLREAADCDVLIMHVQDDEAHFGALLECGAALAAGKTVLLVAPHHWPFLRCHPLVNDLLSLSGIHESVYGGAAKPATPNATPRPVATNATPRPAAPVTPALPAAGVAASTSAEDKERVRKAIEDYHKINPAGTRDPGEK